MYLVLAHLLLTLQAFADDGKVSSLVYFGYSYQTEKNSSAENGFDIDRAYLTYEKKVEQNLGFKFQADVGRLKDSTNTNLYAYLKNALASRSTPYGTFIFGLQGMNIFQVQEKTWGHRFIEKSAMDLNKFSSSADLGIGYANTFSDNFYGSFLITNGGGYKKSETDIYKRYSLLLSYGNTRLDKKDGFNLGATFSYEPYKNSKLQDKTLGGLFAGYAVSGLRLGGEFNILDNSGTDKTQQLVSVYGTYNLISGWQVFTRFDTLIEKSDSENLLIAGFAYSPNKALIIAPNFRTSWNEPSLQNYNLNFQFSF